MHIQLVRATTNDAQQLWQMQHESFMDLLERYQDYDTSPACEPQEKMTARLNNPNTYYYFIVADGQKIGAVRVVDRRNGTPMRISPIYILPKYQNLGCGKAAMAAVFALHGEHGWELGTIEQEARDCHFYEKLGFTLSGTRTIVNDKMTIVGYEKK